STSSFGIGHALRARDDGTLRPSSSTSTARSLPSRRPVISRPLVSRPPDPSVPQEWMPGFGYCPDIPPLRGGDHGEPTPRSRAGPTGLVGAGPGDPAADYGGLWWSGGARGRARQRATVRTDSGSTGGR